MPRLGLDRPTELGIFDQLRYGSGDRARQELRRCCFEGAPYILDRAAPALFCEAARELPHSHLPRRCLVDQRVPEIEKEPADLRGQEAQKKMLTFLASSTFWSRVILRPAIFQVPAMRRRTSRRAPT